MHPAGAIWHTLGEADGVSAITSSTAIDHVYFIILQVQFGIQSGVLDMTAMGETTYYVGRYPSANYLSETFHHAIIGPLVPGQTYFYRFALR